MDESDQKKLMPPEPNPISKPTDRANFRGAVKGFIDLITGEDDPALNGRYVDSQGRLMPPGTTRGR